MGRAVFLTGGSGYVGTRPVMKAYVAARAEAEAALLKSGTPATVLRPWYVLGPGHRWPYALMPLFWLLKRLPATRETATRLGFVTLAQMVAALVEAVERPPSSGVRVVTAEEIARAGGQAMDGRAGR